MRSHRGIRRALLFIVGWFFFTGVDAVYVQSCKVRYETSDGWSDYYTVEVRFLTGEELNAATETYRYRTYSTYAVIFWGKGEASVIKLNGYFSCGSEVDRSCIVNTYRNLSGQDQEERRWEVCVGDYCH